MTSPVTRRDPPSMSRALQEALRSVKTRPEDRAAVVLARQYAAQIDADPDVLVKVGPLVLAVLVELGMTPRARAAVAGRGGDSRDGGAARSALDSLREQHAARINGAATLDPAAS